MKVLFALVLIGSAIAQNASAEDFNANLSAGVVGARETSAVGADLEMSARLGAYRESDMPRAFGFTKGYLHRIRLSGSSKLGFIQDKATADLKLSLGMMNVKLNLEDSDKSFDSREFGNSYSLRTFWDTQFRGAEFGLGLQTVQRQHSKGASYDSQDIKAEILTGLTGRRNESTYGAFLGVHVSAEQALTSENGVNLILDGMAAISGFESGPHLSQNGKGSIIRGSARIDANIGCGSVLYGEVSYVQHSTPFSSTADQKKPPVDINMNTRLTQVRGGVRIAL